MKRILFTVAVLISAVSCAQDKTVNEIKKEIRVENENGQKTVEITTTENGKVTKEVYTGEDADKKLAELENGGMVEVEEETKEVRMEEIDGQKRLTVITKKNGQEDEEVYVGPDAEKKLKELELEGAAPKKMEVKKIERVERSSN